MGEIGEDGGRVYKLLVINYKFWGSNAQHGSQYWVVYLKVAKRINLKSLGEKSNYYEVIVKGD